MFDLEEGDDKRLEQILEEEFNEENPDIELVTKRELIEETDPEHKSVLKEQLKIYDSDDYVGVENKNDQDGTVPSEAVKKLFEQKTTGEQPRVKEGFSVEGPVFVNVQKNPEKLKNAVKVTPVHEDMETRAAYDFIGDVIRGLPPPDTNPNKASFKDKIGRDDVYREIEDAKERAKKKNEENDDRYIVNTLCTTSLRANIGGMVKGWVVTNAVN